MTTEWEPGDRWAEMIHQGGSFPGIWSHLGWSIAESEPGFSVIEWSPTEDHSFPTNPAYVEQGGAPWIVHGGMITAVLDTAMGNATFGLLNVDEVFLTTDLHTQFYRVATPGPMRAHGRVVQKTRRVTFATGELFDAQDRLLAGCRATNLTLKLS